jgi:B-box zinc finger.
MPDNYGRCSQCDEPNPLYHCYFCDEEDLCWDCLQEHKREFHRITKEK